MQKFAELHWEIADLTEAGLTPEEAEELLSLHEVFLTERMAEVGWDYLLPLVDDVIANRGTQDG